MGYCVHLPFRAICQTCIHRFIDVDIWIDWFIIQLYLRCVVDEKHTEFILFYVKMKTQVRINENHSNGYIDHQQQKKLLFPKAYDFHLIFHIIFWMVSYRQRRWSPPLVNLEWTRVMICLWVWIVMRRCLSRHIYWAKSIQGFDVKTKLIWRYYPDINFSFLKKK